MIVRSKLPVNTDQKELNDLLELIHPDIKLNDRILAPEVRQSLQRVLDEQGKIDLLESHGLKARKKLLFTGSCSRASAKLVLS